MDKVKCEVEVFSRVTGFFRPVRQWNPGKQSEFDERKHFRYDGFTGSKGSLPGSVTETWEDPASVGQDRVLQTAP